MHFQSGRGAAGLAAPMVALQHAYNPDSTLADLAAAYAYGLAKNHAFVDGNKRVAFLALGLFLAINGHRLKADQVDAIRTMLARREGPLGLDRRQHGAPLTPPDDPIYDHHHFPS